MANFLTALIRQRNEAMKGENTNERFKEILSILNKYDYDDGITPQIVTSILEDLGPTFVKLGQIASQQSEVIPPEYCDALSKLRSSVAPMDIGTVTAQIEKYLGSTPEELFATFDEVPLGSASIGQVHRATLGDGTAVAVKVRRPGVVEMVARDFALFEKAIDFNLKFMKDKTMGTQVMEMISELERTSRLELDFTNEAANIERFRDLNAHREGVSSPRCYAELTCEAVLTEDFVSGHESSDEAFLETLGQDERDRLAKMVADNFAAQVITDGFYHADPHSGNVLIGVSEGKGEAQERTGGGTSEGKAGPSITWIDFGMMGTLSEQQKKLLMDLVGDVLKRDAYQLKRTVLKIATPVGEIDHGALLEQCEAICDQSNGRDLGDFGLGDLLSMVLTALAEENYRIDPFLTNLARGIIAVEGTVSSISRDVNILNSFLELVNVSLSPENMDVGETLTTVLTKLLKSLEGNTELPAKATEVLDMLEKGQITVHGSHTVEERSMRQIDRMVQNCTIAAMAIALLIGSCILCVMSDPAVTRVVGIPVIGFVGYLIALYLMVRVIRKMGKGE